MSFSMRPITLLYMHSEPDTGNVNHKALDKVALSRHSAQLGDDRLVSRAFPLIRATVSIDVISGGRSGDNCSRRMSMTT